LRIKIDGASYIDMKRTFEAGAIILILIFVLVVVWQTVERNFSKEDNVQDEMIMEPIEEQDSGGSEPVRVPDESGYEIIPPEVENPIACTKEAKICPDGSAVGRVGQNCEFAECPATGGEGEVIVCSPESKLVESCTMDYTPVCGLVEIQCVTTPCNPVPQTFGNACGACSQGNVISYTRGECGV
jgi:hypothetical protein